MAVAAEAMSEDERSQFERLTGTQKSAILMMLLGEDEASEIVRNLSPKEVQHLGTAMYSVQGLDQDTVNLTQVFPARFSGASSLSPRAVG